MKSNPSQYSGTLKNSICNNCTRVLNGLSAEEQERHAQICKKQSKLF